MTKLTSSMMVLKVTMMIMAMKLTPLVLFIMKAMALSITFKIIFINDEDCDNNVVVHHVNNEDCQCYLHLDGFSSA